jgi:hypothetical protein
MLRRLEWTDSPTTATMRSIAAAHARYLTPLKLATLRWSRQYSPTAWAAALLTHADNRTLPDTAHQAVALVEYDLHELDTTNWNPATRRAAADLAHRYHGVTSTKWPPPSSPPA